MEQAEQNPAKMIGNIKSKKTYVDIRTLEKFQKVISLLFISFLGNCETCKFAEYSDNIFCEKPYSP